jgi:pilus assembly protein Flp/PilA
LKNNGLRFHFNLCATFEGKTFSTGSAVISIPTCTGPAGERRPAAAFWNQGAKTMSKFLKLIKNTKGATAIEYGLIAALIAVAAIAAMQSVGNKLNSTFNNVSSKLA